MLKAAPLVRHCSTAKVGSGGTSFWWQLPTTTSPLTTMDDASFSPFKYKKEDCPIPNPDGNLQDAKWSRKTTAISFAEVIVARHLRQRTCKVANELLKDYTLVYDEDEYITNIEEVTKTLKERIDLLLSSSKKEQRNQLFKKLGFLGPKLWYGNMTSMRQTLYKYRKQTFDEAYLEILVCNKFSQKLMVQVDFTNVFSKEMFFQDMDAIQLLSSKRLLGATAIQKTLINIKGKKESNMQTPMFWEQDKDSTKFRFGGHPSDTKAFIKLIAKVLKEVCGAVPESVGTDAMLVMLAENIKLGYLWTIREELQSPHTDYEHDPIRVNLEKMGRKIGLAYMPYSYDCPLNSDGLCLAVWGTEYSQCEEEKLHEVPIRVDVKPSHVLLWRGDLIHGGCLNDPKGNSGALRQHAFLPLHKEHFGMGLDSDSKNNGRLGNLSRNGQRLDAFLLNLKGQKFK